jgi:hypothetical protein
LRHKVDLAGVSRIGLLLQAPALIGLAEAQSVDARRLPTRGAALADC